MAAPAFSALIPGSIGLSSQGRSSFFETAKRFRRVRRRDRGSRRIGCAGTGGNAVPDKSTAMPRVNQPDNVLSAGEVSSIALRKRSTNFILRHQQHLHQRRCPKAKTASKLHHQ